MQIEIKFGDWIQEGFDLYKANLTLLILASLVAVALSTASLGILAGPMGAGMALIVLALIDRVEPKPDIADVFKGFNVFLPSLLLVIGVTAVSAIGYFILQFIPCIGSIASLLFGYAISTLTMFAIFEIVDRGRDVFTAVQASIETVKLNFWPLLGLAVVAGVIGAIGALACWIGLAVTLPLYFTILGIAYRDIQIQMRRI